MIEGVRVTGPDGQVSAVRNEFDNIVCRVKANQPLPADDVPLVRGVCAFFAIIARTMSELHSSAQRAAHYEEDDLNIGQTLSAVAGALLLAMLLFVILPLLVLALGELLAPQLPWLLICALLKTGLFVLYLKRLQRFPDLRRLAAYHAAAHQVINAWEQEWELTPEQVSKASPLDPCCPSNFLLSTMALSIFACSLITYSHFFLGLVMKIGLFLLIAALLYEIFRLPKNNGEDQLVRALITPGLLLQRLSLCRPEKKMYAVAILALCNVPRRPIRQEQEITQTEGSSYAAARTAQHRVTQPTGFTEPQVEQEAAFSQEQTETTPSTFTEISWEKPAEREFSDLPPQEEAHILEQQMPPVMESPDNIQEEATSIPIADLEESPTAETEGQAQPQIAPVTKQQPRSKKKKRGGKKKRPDQPQAPATQQAAAAQTEPDSISAPEMEEKHQPTKEQVQKKNPGQNHPSTKQWRKQGKRKKR